MSRSSALKRPPAPLPSAPAGEPAATAVERERRRGRGTESNASGRYEPLARVAFDDGWQGLEDLPPFKTTVTVDTTRKIITKQRLARHFLRPLDQSLSRLRARLRLLFRAADARLSRPVAGSRFRIQAVHEAERAGIAGARIGGARLCAEDHRHRHQYRSLSADRAAASDHAPHSRSAGARRPSGRHRDQIGAGAARSRHPRAHGQARSGQSGDLGDDARCETGAHHGAARLDAAAPARSAASNW